MFVVVVGLAVAAVGDWATGLGWLASWPWVLELEALCVEFTMQTDGPEGETSFEANSDDFATTLTDTVEASCSAPKLREYAGVA